MTKSYTEQEDSKHFVEEPAIAYQAESSRTSHATPQRITKEVRASIMRAKEQYIRGEYCTQEEMNQKIEAWLG